MTRASFCIHMEKGRSFLDGFRRFGKSISKWSGGAHSAITSLRHRTRYGVNPNFKKKLLSVGLFLHWAIAVNEWSGHTIHPHWTLDAHGVFTMGLSLNSIDFTIVLSPLELGNGHLMWPINSRLAPIGNGPWNVSSLRKCLFDDKLHVHFKSFIHIWCLLAL